MIRRILAGLVALAVLIGVVVVVTLVLPARAVDAAAKQAAARFLELVAEGDEADLEELSGMTIADSPGAMRTAGRMLMGATKRIEVLSVGEPGALGEQVGVPYGAAFGAAVAIPVRMRLDGKDWDWSLTLVKRSDRSGREASDWRVLAANLPALDWGPGRDGLYTDPDPYVSGIRQERRTGLDTGDEVQPLFPAVYRIQRRMDPWAFSAERDIVVVNDPAIETPEFTYQPTERTRNRIQREFTARTQYCADAVEFVRCPAEDLALAVGVRSLGSHDWWRGVVRQPQMEFEGDTITLSDGVARVRGPNGIRKVRFAGTARYFYDNRIWKPTLFELTLVYVP